MRSLAHLGAPQSARRALVRGHPTAQNRRRAPSHHHRRRPNAHTLITDISLVDVPSAADGQAKARTQVALWRLQPVTGRTHQLRLHLSELGFPILGDQVYPEVLPEEAERSTEPLHLLCAEMSFTDPLSGQRRHFSSRRSVFQPLSYTGG